MNHDDERDYAEEAANQADMEREYAEELEHERRLARRRRTRWTGWMEFPEITLPGPLGPLTTPSFVMPMSRASARRGRFLRWRYQCHHGRAVLIAGWWCGRAGVFRVAP